LLEGSKGPRSLFLGEFFLKETSSAWGGENSVPRGAPPKCRERGKGDLYYGGKKVEGPGSGAPTSDNTNRPNMKEKNTRCTSKRKKRLPRRPNADKKGSRLYSGGKGGKTLSPSRPKHQKIGKKGGGACRKEWPAQKSGSSEKDRILQRLRNIEKKWVHSFPRILGKKNEWPVGVLGEKKSRGLKP